MAGVCLSSENQTIAALGLRLGQGGDSRNAAGFQTPEEYVEIAVSETDPETYEELCYIIRPFRGDVWNVSAAVELAASRAGLKPTDLKLDWNPLTILSGSAGKTRNARVVVAILQDRAATQANPNVMYELGLAHALGKPTLIVAKADPGNVPAMINNVPFIALPTDEQVEDDTFFRQITEPLRTLLEQTEYNNIVWARAAPLAWPVHSGTAAARSRLL